MYLPASMLGVADKDGDEDHSLFREIDQKVGTFTHLNKYNKC